MIIYPYVYKLTHKETGHFYFGVRWANKVNAQNDLGKLYFSSSSSIKEMGFENFDFNVIAEFFSKEFALEFEDQQIQENWKNPLSLNKCRAGYKFYCDGHTEETKRKISNSGKGRPAYNKGIPSSPETKAKLSIARRRRITTDETRQKMSNSLKNPSQETRNKISKALTGHPTSDETRKKIGDANRGKPGRIWTQEQKDKMRATTIRNKLLKEQTLINN